MIFRLVVNLEPAEGDLNRGTTYVNMTFHVESPSEEGGMDCAARLAGHFTNFALSRFGLPWAIRRGPEVHFVDVELWEPKPVPEVGYERTARLGRFRFGVPVLPEPSIEVPGAELLSANLKVVWPLESSRAAITVQMTGEDGSKRRVYVGPVSPVAILGSVSIPVWGDIGRILVSLDSTAFAIPGLSGTVPPWGRGYPGVDYSPDKPHPDMAQWAADWVLAIDEALYPSGGLVVLTSAGISYLSSCRASSVYAYVTTRGERGKWIPTSG